MINIRLLYPSYIVDQISSVDTDITNKEGFLRQVVGWREYMRYLYEYHYDEINANHFLSLNKLPKKWTNFGLEPFDNEMKKGIEYGYSHHIIRLMVFLNLFVMMQIDPNDVYTWFMENIALDAYDWVMRSNIYCMGWYFTGAMVKPYISTSNYLLKMGNYPKGDWCKIWDALFYNFLSQNKHKLIGGSRVYLHNLVYYEKLHITKQKDMLHSWRMIL